jgi:hypothetical protein
VRRGERRAESGWVRATERGMRGKRREERGEPAQRQQSKGSSSKRTEPQMLEIEPPRLLEGHDVL